MHQYKLAAFLLCAVLLSIGGMSVRAAEKSLAVVGYLPEYRIAEANPRQLSALTDLIYFSLEPSKEGTLPDQPIPPDTLKKLSEIQKVSQCRILISIGGWGRSKSFPDLAADPTARKKFVTALTALCQTNGFAGIDLDWEHPKGEVQLESYRLLLSETREQFAPLGLLVTVAQASWQDLGEGVYQVVDRVHLMSYDHEFPQATMAKAKEDVERLLAWGCPARKIALGVPFYGRNKERETQTYRQLIAGRAFDATESEWKGFAFNGRRTMSEKVDYVGKKGLGGIMIWEVGQDSTEVETSLLAAINEGMERLNNSAEKGE